MIDAILVLNAGSSSLKFSVFRAGARPSPDSLLCSGEISGIGDRARFRASGAAGTVPAEVSIADDVTQQDALHRLLRWLGERTPPFRLAAVGHRVVHGGMRYAAPALVDARVVAELRRLVPLAPLHQPHPLAAIEALRAESPSVPQIACFDTAFHHEQPRQAAIFALPRALTEAGIRRYGFHGLSYEYIAEVLPSIAGADVADGRVVVAHLGAGASLCAMRQRRSVATTMSFTALDGLPMGRRCGNLDPGVVLYLIEEKAMSVAEVSDLLYQRSGLLGVSGLSDDMRALLASDDAHAAEAVDLFVYRVGRELGSLVAALGGLDALVFTGGIGEHAGEIRRRVCADAAWLGIEFDAAANAAGGPCISRGGAEPSAWVIPAGEELMIARHVWNLLHDAAAEKLQSGHSS